MTDINPTADASPADYDRIRADVVQRVIDKMKLADTLKEAQEQLAAHAGKESLITPGRRHFGADVNAMMMHLDMMESVVRDDIFSDTSQLGFLIARDVIEAEVRGPFEGLRREPIVMLTGNRYMPPCRSFDDMEAIWQEDSEGTYFVAVWERVEQRCDELDIYLGQPEYDNCIYGVDTRLFEPSEAAEQDQPMDDLNDEWSRIDPEPKGD